MTVRPSSLKWAFTLPAFLLLFGPATTSLHAMSVQPVAIDMAVAGQNAKASIQVVNDGTKPLPVDFQIFAVDLGVKGERFEKPASEDFLVFPPQAIVAPGATQVFRVQWVGSTELRQSRSYIFSVNQIPVKMAKNASGVQVVFNFGVVVNVAPPGGHAALKQVAAEIGRDDHGIRRPAIVVENSGNMHAYLSQASITLEGGSWRQRLSGSELGQYIGLGLVQPGKRRRFLLPVELPPSVTQVSAKLEYVPKQAK